MQRLTAAASPSSNCCRLKPAPVLDRDPDWAVPVSPTVIPRHLSPRRPWRCRRWRRRPWWRPVARSVAGRATVVVLPVAAVIPVEIRAPTIVPIVAGAPVVVKHRSRRRRRLGDARGQSEGGQGNATTRQHAGAQAKPRSCFLVSSHASKCFPCGKDPKRLIDFLTKLCR
jgi:hypothetical protein